VAAAYRAGDDLMTFAANFGHPIDLAITCDKDDTEWEGKIAATCAAKGIPTLRRKNANSEEVVRAVKEAGIDIMFLMWWPGIVKQEAISAARQGWVNLHPSLLPYGRGKHGYYWSIIEDKPFGVSLHFIDAGIDTGRVLFQKEMPVSITDTGETLYKKSFDACLELWKESYGKVVAGNFTPQAQDDARATYHWGREIAGHSLIDLDRSYRAGDLINIIRGRTFWQGDSACFHKDGKKYLVRIAIEEAGPA
jgi:methionyl-tRNA formyltransferase